MRRLAALCARVIYAAGDWIGREGGQTRIASTLHSVCGPGADPIFAGRVRRGADRA